MIRFIIVIIIIVVILFILRSRPKGNIKINQNKYRAIILTIIVLGLLFLIATSGRYILPQVLQLIKVGLPFLTKFIGI
jgi:asparagine N-glycosylation enzyme membrane subunit Stt3